MAQQQQQQQQQQQSPGKMTFCRGSLFMSTNNNNNRSSNKTNTQTMSAVIINNKRKVESIGDSDSDNEDFYVGEIHCEPDATFERKLEVAIANSKKPRTNPPDSRDDFIWTAPSEKTLRKWYVDEWVYTFKRGRPVSKIATEACRKLVRAKLSCNLHKLPAPAEMSAEQCRILSEDFGYDCCGLCKAERFKPKKSDICSTCSKADAAMNKSLRGQ